MVDSAGQLADGTRVNGPSELRAALLDRSDQFVRTITEKLLTYALGRGLAAEDMPVVRSIVDEAAGSDHRLSSLFLGIVNSTPFRMKQASGEAENPSIAEAP
jgi:hypothetical protein